MTPDPSVLIGLEASDVRARLAGWVERLGYEPAVTDDGRETVAWVRERSFAASLLDSGLEAAEGGRVWRVVRPILGRRLVLMAREPSNELWYEALLAGVAALLPLPPEEATVRAALAAATGRGFSRGAVGRVRPTRRAIPDAEDQAAE